MAKKCVIQPDTRKVIDILYQHNEKYRIYEPQVETIINNVKKGDISTMIALNNELEKFYTRDML